MSETERRSILSELTPPLDVRRPAQQTVPFVFSSPHSGRVYPKVLLERARLDANSLRKSEDAYVDELFAHVVDMGAPLIAARFPRAYLDVNREPYELDPALFHERLPDYANTRSLRVIGGLGTIARVVAEREEIYRDRLSVTAAFERIERLYRPYHDTLNALLEDTRRRFGLAILIDCHSMPSTQGLDGAAGSRPDFVLGDRFGASCGGALTRLLHRTLADMGYKVACNRPYAGGYITEHYGRPAEGLHAMQIEINRALYMDEARFTKTAGFEPLRDVLDGLCRTMFDLLPLAMSSGRAAAE